MTLPPSAGAVSLGNAVLSGHPLRDVVVGDGAAISAFGQGGIHSEQARPLAVPLDSAARLRFVQAFLAEQAARRSRGLSPQLLVLPLLGVLGLGAEAQGAGLEEGWVDASLLSPVVEVIPQNDGSVVLVLPGGKVARFAAEDIRVEGDTVFVPRLLAYARGLATPEDGAAPQPLTDLPTIDEATLGADGVLTVRKADGTQLRFEDPELASAPGAAPAATLKALQAMELVPVAALPPSASALDALSEQPVAAAGNTILAAGGAMLGGLAFALGSGGGGSDGGTTTVPTVPTIPTASNTTGFVVDGYLAGATVTRGTSTVVTNPQGFFSGLGGPAVAPIVVTGGVDITTGQNFTGLLAAPGSATVVTPLTTLVQALVTDGASLQSALASVASGLGLPDAVASTDGAQSLLSFDPLATLAQPSASAADKALALEVFKRGVEVATVLQRVAEGDETTFVTLTGALAQAVATGGVDPTDGATLTTLLTASGAPQDLIDEVPELVAAISAVRAAESVEAVAVVQQTALASVPGVAPDNAPALPAPTLSVPEGLGLEVLTEGLTVSVAVPAAAASQLPTTARATVTVLAGSEVLAILTSGAATDGVFTVVLTPAVLATVDGASLGLKASIAAPGTGLVSPAAELTVTLAVVEAVNAAATTAQLDAALGALEAGGLLGTVPAATLTGAQRAGALADLLAARPAAGFADLAALESTLTALGGLYDGVAAVEKAFASGPTLASLETAARTLQSLADQAADANITTFQGTAIQPNIDAVETELARIALLSPAGRAVLGEALNNALILAAADAIEAGTQLALNDALGLVAQAFPAALGVTAKLETDTGAADGISQDGRLLLAAEPNATLALSLDGGQSFSPLSAPSTTLPEGAYPAETLQVRATLGGASVVTKLGAFTIDAAAPGAPTVVLPGTDGTVADATNEDAFTFSGTAEPGALVALVWGDARASVTADGAGAWSLTVAGSDRPALGTTTVRVTATDAAGNVSGAATASLTLADNTPDIGVTLPEGESGGSPAFAPTLTVTQTLLGAGDLAAVAYSVSGLAAEQGATLRFFDGQTRLDVAVTANGSGTVDLSTLGDGAITSELVPLGGGEGVAGRALTLDRTADGGTPASLTLGASTLGAADLAAVAFTVAGLDQDATAVVRFSDGTDKVTAAVSANGAGVVDLSSLADGALTTTLSITDQAGNTATINGPAVTLDSSAPARPTLDAIAGDGFVNAAEAAAGLTLSGTAEAGLTVSVGLGDETRTATADASGAFSVTFAAAAIPADGTYTVTAAGASATVVVDRTADGGTPASLTLEDGVLRANEVGAAPFTVAGLDEDATAVARFSDGTSSVTAAVTGNGRATVDLSSLADGPVTTTLSITDQAGNSASVNGGGSEINTGPPGLLFSSETGLFLNREALAAGVDLTGRASNLDAGTTVTVALGALSQSAVLTSDGTWAVAFGPQALATLDEGPATLTVSAPDGAGGTATQTRSLTIDGTAPTVALTATLGSQNAQALAEALVDGAFTLRGTTAADTASLTVSLGSTTVTATLNGQGAFTAAMPRGALSEGANGFTFEASDSAGNSASGPLGTLTLDRLSVLNGLSAEGNAPEGFLAALGEATGLAESTLAGLDAQGASTVLAALIANRPSGGYDSLDALGEVLTPVAAYAAQFTTLRALRSGTASELDLDAFAAAVEGAVGLTLGGEVLTAASAEALDAGLARLAALEATAPSQYAALLPLAATLALGDVSEASLNDALGRLEAGLAGETLAFNAYDITPQRITEFETTLARLSDEAVSTVTTRLTETDLTRFAEPLSSLQDALLRGILQDVRTLELPGDTAALAEPFRLTTQGVLTDLILNNVEAGRAVTAADFREGGRIDVLRSGLVIAENDPDISLDFGISIGALQVESAALQRLLDIFAAYGDPSDENTITSGQAALVASVTGQLEFDLNDATLAALNGAGSKAAMAAALERLEGVSALADPGVGLVSFASEADRTAVAEALFEARLAAGGTFASLEAATTGGSTGTAWNERFLLGAGEDELDLGGGVDTVVLAGNGVGEGPDTLAGFLFGPEADGGDVLSLPGADGELTVLADPQASLDADALADALVASLDGDPDPVTYVLAQESAPAEGVADGALARVSFDGTDVSAELLVRFIDAGPSFDALVAHNLPDFSGL